MAKRNFIRKSAEQLIDIPLTGVMLSGVGGAFTGGLAPIGRATQAVIAVGALKRSKQRFL